MPNIELMFPTMTEKITEAYIRFGEYIKELGESGKMEIEDTDFGEILVTSLFAAVVYAGGGQMPEEFKRLDDVNSYRKSVLDGTSSEEVMALCQNYMNGNRTVTREQLMHVRGVCFTLLEYIRFLEQQ